jgi:hypothetical protein
VCKVHLVTQTLHKLSRIHKMEMVSYSSYPKSEISTLNNVGRPLSDTVYVFLPNCCRRQANCLPDSEKYPPLRRSPIAYFRWTRVDKLRMTHRFLQHLWPKRRTHRTLKLFSVSNASSKLSSEDDSLSESLSALLLPLFSFKTGSNWYSNTSPNWFSWIYSIESPELAKILHKS